jgi:hypothetical protein
VVGKSQPRQEGHYWAQSNTGTVVLELVKITSATSYFLTKFIQIGDKNGLIIKPFLQIYKRKGKNIFSKIMISKMVI